MQRGVVEFEFFQGVAQGVVLVGLGGIEASKHLRLNFFKTWQSFFGGAEVIG